MKTRFIALASSAVLSLAVLSGCGGSADKYADSDYLGIWNATTAEYAGLSLDASAMFDEFSLTFDPSGEVIATINGEENTGTWEETENGVLITDDSDEEMEFTADDGNLILEQDGVLITFELAEES